MHIYLIIRSKRTPNLLPQPTTRILSTSSSNAGLRRGQSAREAELGGDSFDAVRGVDVLDERDLVACCAALAGDDGRVGEEVFPYLGKCDLISSFILA